MLLLWTFVHTVLYPHKEHEGLVMTLKRRSWDLHPLQERWVSQRGPTRLVGLQGYQFKFWSAQICCLSLQKMKQHCSCKQVLDRYHGLGKMQPKKTRTDPPKKLASEVTWDIKNVGSLQCSTRFCSKQWVKKKKKKQMCSWPTHLRNDFCNLMTKDHWDAGHLCSNSCSTKCLFMQTKWTLGNDSRINHILRTNSLQDKSKI